MCSITTVHYCNIVYQYIVIKCSELLNDFVTYVSHGHLLFDFFILFLINGAFFIMEIIPIYFHCMDVLFNFLNFFLIKTIKFVL